MSEGLRTLEDLKGLEAGIKKKPYCTRLIREDDLKAEAVKRAKHWNEKVIHYRKVGLPERELYFQGRLDEVMEANDLTEKDLEENKDE